MVEGHATTSAFMALLGLPGLGQDRQVMEGTMAPQLLFEVHFICTEPWDGLLSLFYMPFHF
jgi:hypothetical protein